MSTLRILVADDHEVVRQGLRVMLENQPGWEVCGEALTGIQAVEKAKTLRPDVVVLDFGMPELNGLEAARQIHQALPQTEVLILTMYESKRLAREFLAAGARAFVLKADAGRVLVQAVQQVSQHQPFVSTNVSEAGLGGVLGPDFAGSPDPGTSLTAREREIVRLVGEGKISKEIADCLEISVHTVETHRTNIMRKLDIHTVGELVRYAIRHKLAQAW